MLDAPTRKHGYGVPAPGQAPRITPGRSSTWGRPLESLQRPRRRTAAASSISVSSLSFRRDAADAAEPRASSAPMMVWLRMLLPQRRQHVSMISILPLHGTVSFLASVDGPAEAGPPGPYQPTRRLACSTASIDQWPLAWPPGSIRRSTPCRAVPRLCAPARPPRPSWPRSRHGGPGSRSLPRPRQLVNPGHDLVVAHRNFLR
jgi:hypothetical protein